MTFDRTIWSRRAVSPLGNLASALLASVVLVFLPANARSLLKDTQRRLLAPALVRVSGLQRQLAAAADQWQRVSVDAERLQTLQRELAASQSRNARLEATLGLALDQLAQPVTDGLKTPSLLVARLVEARVLGPQSRAWLEARTMVAAGSAAGLDPAALVFAADRPQVDVGTHLGLDAGQWVLAGRSVWGRLDEVGKHTATVRLVTDKGYRDVVQLGRLTDDQIAWGPRGVIEGGGEPTCRIRMIDVTAPVSEGDIVFAGDPSLMPAPPVYGRVARVERPVGAAHWEIWMQPAAAAELPVKVAIIRTELNPSRIGIATSESSFR